MKIFALYLRLVLTSKPEWFDELRSKYSSTSILHITLIQSRYVSGDQIQDLKDIVFDTLSTSKFSDPDRQLVFSQTELEENTDGTYLLMSFVKENKSIMALQKNLVNALQKYNNYCNEETKGYELNFRPHLTVADQIDQSYRDKTLDLISENSHIKGKVDDLVLATVNEQITSESENPDNWSIFDI